MAGIFSAVDSIDIYPWQNITVGQLMDCTTVISQYSTEFIHRFKNYIEKYDRDENVPAIFEGIYEQLAEVILRKHRVNVSLLCKYDYRESLKNIFGYGNYNPSGISRFRCGRKYFKLPAAGIDIAGKEKFFIDINASVFCEVTDMVNENRGKYASLILALCCCGRSCENEHSLNRYSRAMKNVNLPVYYELLYMIDSLHSYFAEEFPNCYSGPDMEAIAVDTTARWSDLIYWTARFIPSEIERLKVMDCYEFMKILNTGIKAGFFE